MQPQHHAHIHLQDERMFAYVSSEIHAHIHLQDERMFAYVSSEIHAQQKARLEVENLSKAVEQAVSWFPSLICVQV